jgi:hypothetical protein
MQVCMWCKQVHGWFQVHRRVSMVYKACMHVHLYMFVSYLQANVNGIADISAESPPRPNGMILLSSPWEIHFYYTVRPQGRPWPYRGIDRISVENMLKDQSLQVFVKDYY